MDDFTKAKICVCGSQNTELHRDIDPDCLEERFGGTLPNKEDNFFPPDVSMPNDRLVASDFEKRETAAQQVLRE